MRPDRSPDAAAAPVGRACSIFLLLLLAALAATPARAADPEFPALTGRVVDAAALLTAEETARIVADLEALEDKTTDQLVLVTLQSLQGFPIEEFGYKLGRHWVIGQQGKDNGVLLIVAPNERKVRIEVGRGLEGVLPDAMARIIIENAILPAFRSGDFPGGIRAGLRDITAVLTGDAEAVKQRARKGTGGNAFDWVAIVILTVWVIIFIFVIWSMIRSAQQGVVPGKGKKSSGWTFGPGSSSGGWSGGGGFSGGGGGFGGGGASGGW